MISFKKNDKIIIIVAVIVLITAGIGIAVYQSPTPPENYEVPTGAKTFEVSMDLKEKSLDSLSEFAGKKAPYEGTTTITQGNVKSIVFNLTWIDDRTTFFKRLGLDIMKLEVTAPNGDTYTAENKTASITAEGKLQLIINFNIIPPVTPIKADNEKDALAKLKTAPYYDDSLVNKEFTYKISCQIGEIRLLKKLRDRGNDFDLKISYEYYEGSLKEDKTVPIDQNDPTPEDPWTPPYMSMIISTGCGRYV